MSLSKQNYEAIAEIISQVDSHNPSDADYAEGWFAAVIAIRGRLITYFSQDNPNFDPDRFSKACRGNCQ